MPATGKSAVALLLKLLPHGGRTWDYQGHNVDGHVQGRTLYDDGYGAGSVIVYTSRDTSTSGAPSGCAVPLPTGLSRLVGPGCSDHILPDGSRAMIVAMDLTSDGRDPNLQGKIQFSVHLQRPNGTAVQATSCNGQCGVLGPATRPMPSLTLEQLYMIVSDPRWQVQMERALVREAETLVLTGEGSY